MIFSRPPSGLIHWSGCMVRTSAHNSQNDLHSWPRGSTGNAGGSYAAGNKQTFNLDTGEGIRASGGFLDAQYKCAPKWITHGGFMIDSPLDRDVPLSGRTYQQNAYSNIMYIHSRYLQIGCEVAHLWSGFKNRSMVTTKLGFFITRSRSPSDDYPSQF